MPSNISTLSHPFDTSGGIPVVYTSMVPHGLSKRADKTRSGHGTGKAAGGNGDKGQRLASISPYCRRLILPRGLLCTAKLSTLYGRPLCASCSRQGATVVGRISCSATTSG